MKAEEARSVRRAGSILIDGAKAKECDVTRAMTALRKSRAGLSTINPSLVYRLFYPQVPVIIAAKSGDRVSAMPANSCISVSVSPSMIAVSIFRESRTLSTIEKSGSFSLSWLDHDKKEMRKAILDLAKPSIGAMALDKLEFLGVPYSLIERVPVLSDCVAYVLCHTVRVLKTGDHDLVLGRVFKAQASKDFSKENYWQFKEYRPMLYLGNNRPEKITTI